MAAKQGLQVQQKRELETKEERRSPLEYLSRAPTYTRTKMS